MSKLFNRAKMTTATTGTGNLTLGSAASGFVTFATAGVLNGDVVRYCIEAENGTDFEIGEGTYTASGTVLSRADADVQLSSNGNNRITLAAGTHNVFITAADSDFTQEIIVTVANAGAGNKYVIDGTSQQIITLLPSITYRLDQSDSSNATHPLVLASGSADGSTYSTGVRVVGTPGSKNSYTEVKLEQDAPALWFKCSNHAGMGNSINLAAPASGGVTSYSNLAGFPSSNNTHGDMAYAQDTKVSYMWLDTSWQRMSIGPQIGPRITTEPPAAHSLQSDGSTSTITIAAVDESGFPITYDWDAVQGSTLYNAASLPTALTSVAESNGVFTLTPSTNSSHATSTLKFRAKASDGVLFTPAITTISLEFTQALEVASGGGVVSTYTAGSTTYKVLRFTASGVLTVNSTTSVDYLIVGGGGSGGNDYGGGGGAGGLVYQASQSLSAANYDVVVGNGGAAITHYNHSNDGTNSTFNGFAANGGGGGGSEGIASQNGRAGGSGGGSGYANGFAGQPNQNSYSGTGFGNRGGTGSPSPNYNPAGGGGSGGFGLNGTASVSGNGGAGKAYDITGTSLFYAAGGGGGFTANGNGQAGVGGSSIGGNGAVDVTSNGFAGAANTGSGGGGASGNQTSQLSGAGATGVVIIRYVVT